VNVRRVALVLMVAYLLAVAWIVFWPSAGPSSSSIVWMSDLLGSLGAPAWMSAAVVEFVANVAMFLPLSFLGSFLIPTWGWKRWLLIGFCGSAVIELAQSVVLPDRSATVLDVVANTLGALLGATLVLPVRDRFPPDGSAEPRPLRREGIP
jgi:glycopeptide antibiotics resistance protein